MSHLRTSTTLISRKPWQRFLKLGLQSQKQRRETVRCMKNKTEEKWSKVDCDTAWHKAVLQAEIFAEEITLL